MVGHYVINCNNKQNGKTRVCKNYYSKKHQTNRKTWYATHGKYQKKTNVKRKKKKSIVVVPPAPVAKTKKRISPTLVSGAGLQQPQVFGSATGQQTFQKALNRIEAHEKKFNGLETAAEMGFASKPLAPHDNSYATGQLRYDPKTGLVMPKKTAKKYQHEYL